MGERNHYIVLKTMTDYHVEEFLKCPYRFYHQQVLGKKGTYSDWRHVVQYTINKVIYDFFRLPMESRSALKVLKLIEMYWVKESQHFESNRHYYTVLAKVTDHLMYHLLTDRKAEPPLFLFEKFNTKIEELHLDLSVTIQLAEWSKGSFVIKKYIVGEDSEMLTAFKHMMILFANRAFDSLPKTIEVISLLSGKVHVIHPTEKDVDEALEYLSLIKGLLTNPENYQKTKKLSECHTCSFKEACEREAHFGQSSPRKRRRGSFLTM